MATASAGSFSGTNTEKIDQLVAAVVELRTTVRLATWVLSVCFPLMVGLQAFVLNKASDTSAKLDRVIDRLDRLERPKGG